MWGISSPSAAVSAHSLCLWTRTVSVLGFSRSHKSRQVITRQGRAIKQLWKNPQPHISDIRWLFCVACGICFAVLTMFQGLLRDQWADAVVWPLVQKAQHDTDTLVMLENFMSIVRLFLFFLVLAHQGCLAVQVAVAELHNGNHSEVQFFSPCLSGPDFSTEAQKYSMVLALVLLLSNTMDWFMMSYDWPWCI